MLLYTFLLVAEHRCMLANVQTKALLEAEVDKESKQQIMCLATERVLCLSLQSAKQVDRGIIRVKLSERLEVFKFMYVCLAVKLHQVTNNGLIMYSCLLYISSQLSRTIGVS